MTVADSLVLTLVFVTVTLIGQVGWIYFLEKRVDILEKFVNSLSKQLRK